MVRPSNPRLMARVLDAVMNLGDTKGSSAREVLSFIRESNVSPKNLTVQVHRALKHAVNAGLLRHRSGRYKVLATLTPTSVPTQPASKESTNGEKKTEKKKSKSDVQTPIGDAESSSRRTQERKKRTTSRQQRSRSRHRSSKARRRTRRSPYPGRPNTSVQNRKRRQRKHIYDNEEIEDQSSGRYILHERNESSVPFNRKTKRSRVSKRELESDFSDESDRESDVNRKRVSRSKKPLSREPRRKEVRTKSKKRSASRARSPQLLQRTIQARQYAIEEVRNDRQQCNENRESACQETHEEEDVAVEVAREPNDSNSGSTLENPRN